MQLDLTKLAGLSTEWDPFPVLAQINAAEQNGAFVGGASGATTTSVSNPQGIVPGEWDWMKQGSSTPLNAQQVAALQGMMKPPTPHYAPSAGVGRGGSQVQIQQVDTPTRTRSTPSLAQILGR